MCGLSTTTGHNSDIIIPLSHQELTTATLVGVRRQLSAIECGRQHWGVLASSEDLAFENHIIGAMGELAAARYFNLFWDDHVGEIDGGDIGGVIEVRTRRALGSGLDLAMRNKDLSKALKPFVLVHANPPKFRLIGWLHGDEAWRIGKPNDKTGLRYVPVGSLRAIADLKITR